VTWAAPADAGSHPITGYRVTLTSADGATVAQDVAADVTRVAFTGVAPGRWSATVVGTSDAGSSEPSAASPVATVGRGQPVPLLTTAYALCLGRTVTVGALAVNLTAPKAEVSISILGDDKTPRGMPRGGVLTHVVDSVERSLPAGTVTVTATRQVDGVGYTSTYALDYRGASCRR